MSEETITSLKSGDVLDERYELLEQIGEGGFGVVFRAKQRSTGQNVAVKALLPERLTYGTAVARFEREMHTVARLHHAHIVRLIDSGKLADGTLYMVLEFIEGRALSTVLIEDGPLTVKTATHVMRQVLDALSYAHEQGVVHRDLKPDNIMLSPGGVMPNAKVLDFGIAAMRSEDRDEDYKSITRGGNVPGTPAYMAPEQLREPNPQVESDIYAWGLVFAESLTGEQVVNGKSAVDVMLRHADSRALELPAKVEASVVGAIIRNAIHKRMGDRFASARAALEALGTLNLDAVPDETLASMPRLVSTRQPRLNTAMAATVESTDSGELSRMAETLDAAEVRLASERASVTGPDANRSGEAFAKTQNALVLDQAGTNTTLETTPPGSSSRIVIALVVLLAGAAIAIVVLLTRDAPSPTEAAEPNTRPTGETTHSATPGETTTSPTPKLDTDVAEEPRPAPPDPIDALRGATVALGAFTAPTGLDADGLKQAVRRFPDHEFDLDYENAILTYELVELPALRVMAQEVTWADFPIVGDAAAVASACGDSADPADVGRSGLPARGIAAAEAAAWCTAVGMRLPTSREWEAIARGPEGRAFALAGDHLDGDRAAQLGAQLEVSRYDWSTTPDGIFDLAGSVSEWTTCESGGYCRDGFAIRGGASTSADPFWYFAPAVGVPPKGENPSCARLEHVGFRCVMDAEVGVQR